jgi:hypothetical protein
VSFIDRIDGALATAIAGRDAQREARGFEASVVPGRTYYSVVEVGRGGRQAVMKWTFTKRFGGAVCGHMSAAYVWLNYGPIHDTMPGCGNLKVVEEPAGTAEPDALLRQLGATPAGV